MTHSQWIIRKSCCGSNIAFDSDSPVCESCESLADCCSERAVRRDGFLAALDKCHDAKGRSLKTHYDTVPKVRASRPAVAKAVGTIAISNEKAAAIHATLEARDVDWSAMKRGDNPLAGKRAPEFLVVMVERLLAGSITKVEMIQAITASCGISDRAAKLYLNTGVSLLAAVNIIDPAEHTMEILP